MIIKSMNLYLLGITAHNAHPVTQEEIAGDQANQDNSLDHLGDPGRLDLTPRQDQRPKQDRYQDDSERV